MGPSQEMDQLQGTDPILHLFEDLQEVVSCWHAWIQSQVDAILAGRSIPVGGSHFYQFGGIHVAVSV